MAKAKNSAQKPVSAFDLFSKSYEIVIRNIKNFAILLALPGLASIMASYKYNAPSASERWSHINFFGINTEAFSIVTIFTTAMVAFLLLAVVALFIQAMLTSLQVEGAKNKTPTFQQLFEMAKKYWLRLFGLFLVIGMYIIGASLIGIMALVVLRNALGVLIGVGLIIAAVVFVMTHYYLASYAMIDGDLKIFEAMETSANLSKKNIGAVLSVLGVTILLSFSGMVPIVGPILSFVLGAIYSVAPALRYLELKNLH